MKKSWIILVIIAIIGFAVYNSHSFKFRNYDFTPEQVKFLNSLNISDTHIRSRDSDKNEFSLSTGDSNSLADDLIVKVDDNFNITQISYFLNSDKVIYDKKANVERKYVSATERNKTIADFIASHEVEYNQSKQVTTVDPVKYPVPFWHCGIFNYLVYRGQADEYTKDTAFPSIFTLFHYSGRNWLFVNKIIFSTKSNSWTYYVDEQRQEQVVTGGVHEFIYVPFAKVLNGMQIVVDGENPQIELVGDKGSKIIHLNSDDITNIKKYINLYENI